MHKPNPTKINRAAVLLDEALFLPLHDSTIPLVEFMSNQAEGMLRHQTLGKNYPSSH